MSGTRRSQFGTRSALPPLAASTRSSTIQKICYRHPMPHQRYNPGKHDRDDRKDGVTIAFAIEVLTNDERALSAVRRAA